MNSDFEKIRRVLERLKNRYTKGCSTDLDDAALPVTERDIVADIHQALNSFCKRNSLHVHCEMRPASGLNMELADLKRLPRIDVVILQNTDKASWLDSAKKLQNKYRKGAIEARFSSVPVRFFHTAIEAKIQSNVGDAKKDIDTLKSIQQTNPSCNSFFLLFNARGRLQDHDYIVDYGRSNSITVIEYTARRRWEKR